MKSFIGRPYAWNIDSSNPYVVYSIGVKQEGHQFPAKFASSDLAMNALMQTLVDLILENKDKDIVWRRYPEVSFDDEYDDFTKTTTRRYYATARLCFEDK